MSAQAAFVRNWQVGVYTATLSARRPDHAQAMCVVIEWFPRLPARLDATELQQYRRGRDSAIAQLAHEFGIQVALVDGDDSQPH